MMAPMRCTSASVQRRIMLPVRRISPRSIEDEGDEALGEAAVERRMALQEPEGGGAAERVDDEVDIHVAANLAPVDRSPQDLPRDFPSPRGEVREDSGPGARIDLRLGDEAPEGGPRDGARLHLHDLVHDVFEIGRDVARLRILQLLPGDLEVEVHAERGLGRPMAIDGGLRDAALGSDALHGEAHVAVALEDLACGLERTAAGRALAGTWDFAGAFAGLESLFHSWRHYAT